MYKAFAWLTVFTLFSGFVREFTAKGNRPAVAEEYRVINLTDHNRLEVQKALEQLKDSNQPIRLELLNSKITDDDLKTLPGLKSLRMLFLNGTSITDVGVKYISDIRQLEVLHLSGTKITDSALTLVRKLSELKDLALSDTAVTDVGLKNISEMKTLELLSLDQTQITDEGIGNLNKLTNLRFLTLTSTKITDRGIQRMSRFDSLIHFELYLTPITDKAVQHIAVIAPRLKVLNINHTDVTDASLDVLQNHPTLQRLYISETKVTEGAVVRCVTSRKEWEHIGFNFKQFTLDSIALSSIKKGEP